MLREPSSKRRSGAARARAARRWRPSATQYDVIASSRRRGASARRSSWSRTPMSPAEGARAPSVASRSARSQIIGWWAGVEPVSSSPPGLVACRKATAQAARRCAPPNQLCGTTLRAVATQVPGCRCVGRAEMPAPPTPDRDAYPLTRTDVLSTAEAADLLGLPRSTVHHLARRGELPARRVGRRWLFLRHRLAAAITPLGEPTAWEPPANGRRSKP
jgi:excisionase family DNA binding protein